MLVKQSEVDNGTTLCGKVLKEHYSVVEAMFHNVEKKRETIGPLLDRIVFMETALRMHLPEEKYQTTFDVRQYTLFPGDFHINVKNIVSWGELSPFLEAISPLWPLEEWESHDDADSYSRVYENGHACDFVCKLTATLLPDSSDCRRVITGWTKHEVILPKPIYGFDCLDSPTNP